MLFLYLLALGCVTQKDFQGSLEEQVCYMDACSCTVDTVSSFSFSCILLIARFLRYTSTTIWSLCLNPVKGSLDNAWNGPCPQTSIMP